MGVRSFRMEFCRAGCPAVILGFALLGVSMDPDISPRVKVMTNTAGMAAVALMGCMLKEQRQVIAQLQVDRTDRRRQHEQAEAQREHLQGRMAQMPSDTADAVMTALSREQPWRSDAG